MRRCVVSSIHAFLRERSGLATIEYVVGAAVILGTLVVGVSAWNNGLVARLQSLVTQLAGVR
jgi:Flp pilus assembly pilin Flp